MIGRLSGKLVHKQPPQLLLDVGGVGYELEAPMSTFYKLPAVGAAVTLHTHLTVREDAHLLFGFFTLNEKALFRALIRISGVGPKLALAILSGISADEFWNAIRAGDAMRFSKLPGIGKKTAERLIVEMRDKSDRAGDAGLSLQSTGLPASPLEEARAALEALGYKPAESQRLAEAVNRDGMSTDQIIREALRRAAR
ncbi:MAG: Holliday junction branch migration protein RuvA [Gammaproteobacteria bacterium]|jgi:holliday junction DNA helicase RuvA